jgi:hypothetical protein
MKSLPVRRSILKNIIKNTKEDISGIFKIFGIFKYYKTQYYVDEYKNILPKNLNYKLGKKLGEGTFNEVFELKTKHRNYSIRIMKNPESYGGIHMMMRKIRMINDILPKYYYIGVIKEPKLFGNLGKLVLISDIYDTTLLDLIQTNQNFDNYISKLKYYSVDLFYKGYVFYDLWPRNVMINLDDKDKLYFIDVDILKLRENKLLNLTELKDTINAIDEMFI